MKYPAACGFVMGVTFELCAETLAACAAARPGGADRIELCSALSEDGLTPSHGFLRRAIALSGLPVYAIVRPRAGDFCYSAAEFDAMREDVVHAMTIGASGVVLGVLLRDGRVDIARTAELVRAANGAEVTFHRAFDRVPDLSQALEDVIAADCRRVLTSGGQPDALAGAAVIRTLVEQAGDRTIIAVGGGLRANNAAEIVRLTGATSFHGSARPAGLKSGDAVRVEDVRALVSAVRS